MSKLRNWRKRQGLTQRKLAEALGLTDSAITKYESGAQRPRPELARRIEAYTKGEVSAASLLGAPEASQRGGGVREDAEAFDGAEQLTIEVPISADQSRLLSKQGVDVEGIALAGAQKALKEAEARAWAEVNREAINAYNKWIEKHGTLAEQLGLI